MQLTFSYGLFRFFTRPFFHALVSERMRGGVSDGSDYRRDKRTSLRTWSDVLETVLGTHRTRFDATVASAERFVMINDILKKRGLAFAGDAKER